MLDVQIDASPHFFLTPVYNDIEQNHGRSNENNIDHGTESLCSVQLQVQILSFVMGWKTGWHLLGQERIICTEIH